MLNAALETEISRVERGERRTLEVAQLRVDLENTITNLENDSLDRVAAMIDDYQSIINYSTIPEDEKIRRVAQIQATENQVLLRLVTNLRSQITILDRIEETMGEGGGGNNLPEVGDIRTDDDGNSYEYIGGNPSDESSWQLVN